VNNDVTDDDPRNDHRGDKPKLHHVARRLGVSPRTVRWMAQNHLIPAQKRGLKIWIFVENDVERCRHDRHIELTWQERSIDG
jgi:hypothetical protein